MEDSDGNVIDNHFNISLSKITYKDLINFLYLGK